MKSISLKCADGVTRRYAVNSAGNGLFCANEKGGWAYHQHLGTAQFHAATRAQFRAALAKREPRARMVASFGWAA